MARILLVEDSNAFGVLMCQKIEEALSHQVVWTTNYAQTKNLLESPDTDFFVAVLDLRLPDANDGEIVDLVLHYGIPVIIVTTEINDAFREKFFTKPIVDYILKNSIHCFTLVADCIRRLEKNPDIKVLVVDDTKTTRALICRLLDIHKYHVLEAENGQTALQRLASHPDIKVVITDYSMPVMNGIDLTSALRRQFPKEEMGVMGISALGNTLLPAQFIKNGANDFLTIPFSPEEFYWRLTHIIETIEHITLIRDASIKDFLTGLYNRRYLFDKGQQILNELRESRQDVAVTMIDIDHFKCINDSYGHDTGDKVIQFAANLLITVGNPKNLVARFGGEEFCVLQPETNPKEAFDRVNLFRKKIQNTTVRVAGQEINFTISAGICARPDLDLQEMITRADKKLYEAKRKGRNRVLIDKNPD